MQEYIILPLSQMTIQKLVYKRDGDEIYQIVEQIDVQEARGYGTQGKLGKYSDSAGKAQYPLHETNFSLLLAEDSVIIDEPTSPNLLSNSDRFIAIPSLQ
ncbi:hypothetical protein ACJ72_01553 [Emergomyces africanus]|uniref:Uncharacterized protein n=1 Tax=Emergomyces africanus TaxID=1955775 RepID=A0A1B7P4W5_9EURO|nr:hypothetical protein ACJ72_01553 [Emergomyces africanus]